MNPESTFPKPPSEPNSSSSQEIEDFIYLVSHDVRSSVRALLELPQWITEDLEEAGIPLEGPVANSIELMNRHAGRLDRMLVDLLAYSRIGRMQTVRENNLDEVLDQVLEEIILHTGFEVIRSLECTRATMGDRDILMLFDALIRNALKHHDRASGRIVITTALKGGELVIAVADDGPGVPEQFREKIFGAMHTLRPRDEVEGSGMGLANVRKIATLYGGTAQLVDSPYGRGSQVEVHLSRTPRPN